MRLSSGFRKGLILSGAFLLGVGFILIIFRTWYIYDIIFYTLLIGGAALYTGLTGKDE